MKNWMYVTSMAVILCFGGGLVRAAEEKLPNCPVMGEPIDFGVSTMTEDGPVYFCCKGCVKKFEAEPAKFATQVTEQRAALAKRDKVQVTCPVSGKPTDPKVFVEHNGEKVSFCCKDCVKAFTANPGKYKAALAASYTYQTTCPVMGGKVSPDASSVLPDGTKVYYCCMGCEKKLLAEPEKYAAKLAAQGINIDPAKIKAAGKKDDGHGHDGHDHDH